METHSSPTSFGAFSKSRFRHSVHQIPVSTERPPRYEPWIINVWLVAVVAIWMIGIGIAIQVALHVSSTRTGFHVAEKNLFAIKMTQFLTSFFPSLLAVPLVYFWSTADWKIRWLQPYITLAEGNQPASKSILLDYTASNRLSVLINSAKYKHYLVLISTLTFLAILLLQPLAGSFFQVRPVPFTSASTAISTRTAALSPDVSQLDAFVAAAGYVDAAAYGALGDPPYVHGPWTAAWFEPPPGLYLNGSLTVNTTGIQTKVNCVNPTSLNLTSSGGNYTARATFLDGCFANFSFTASEGNRQYSVLNASSCAPQGQNIEFQPVVFWYYFQDTSSDSGPEVAAVFCGPTIKVFAMTTSMDLSNRTLGNCTKLDTYVQPNNVTGSPLNGQAFNGVVFNQSSNVLISARTNVINSVLPSAIFRHASQQPGGVQSVFKDPYGWLNATSKIYTQHLAIATQFIYFGAANETIHATLTTFSPRLFIDPLPAHALSALLFVVGITRLTVHVLHAHSRRKLWLTSPPGSIASIVSMTSRSGFGELLLPYDDDQQMQDKLTGLKFSLDPHNGAIIAQGEPSAGSEGVPLLSGEDIHLRTRFRTDNSTLSSA